MVDAAVRQARTGRLLGFVSLFGSFGTLICCALPALLVLLGLGATVASVLSAAPWLVSLSRHKDWVFAGSGALIGLTAAYLYSLAPRLRRRVNNCPPGERAACDTADRMSRIVLWTSATVYLIGLFTAYLLGAMLS